ncbi:lasso peptide biosynthesis B2 protein [Streptomyces sp. P38-E01]|uniref:Lasso peptide biosynthesis B2 protein n=2 Tax=Streptomyces tardus TaxID=2780544 RepID=A0A949JHV7_9ACTN|nr:lasso peptide biosynthesis B2 protein [Streptomyces tardus]
MIPWEQRNRRRTLRDRIATRLALTAGYVLARQPARRLRRIMERLSRGARPATRAETQAAVDSVLSASLPMHGLKACLPRSVSVALRCRLRGTWPTWCTGVSRSLPPAAHAWVEADGEPVGEGDGDRGEFAFVKMLVVAPRDERTYGTARTRS